MAGLEGRGDGEPDDEDDEEGEGCHDEHDVEFADAVGDIGREDAADDAGGCVSKGGGSRKEDALWVDSPDSVKNWQKIVCSVHSHAGLLALQVDIVHRHEDCEEDEETANGE